MRNTHIAADSRRRCPEPRSRAIIVQMVYTGLVMQFPDSHAISGQRSLLNCPARGAGELLFRSKVIAQLSGEGCRWIAFQVKGHFNCPARGAGELLFRSKVISIVGRGGAGELLFRSKVKKWRENAGLFRRWTVSWRNILISRTFRKVKKWRENAGLFVSVLIVEWLFRCTVSSKSKPIKEAGFRKKLSFGKYSPRV